MKYVIFFATGVPSALYISAGIASDPEAWQVTEVLLISLFQRLGTRQAADYIPPVLIASSLIDDGRLRILAKCSAHLFKIASLLVRRLVPSALRGGS